MKLIKGKINIVYLWLTGQFCKKFNLRLQYRQKKVALITKNCPVNHDFAQISGHFWALFGAKKVNRRQRGTSTDSPKFIVGSEVTSTDSPKLIVDEMNEMKWWMITFWVFYFYETFICYRWYFILNCYIGKKVQKKFLMGFKICEVEGLEFFFQNHNR